MQLPTLLLRKNPNAYKNTFGHALILAGSRRMLGAASLCGLSAMRSGAGLVTLGVPESLNSTLQKKISPVLMSWPLPETPEQSYSSRAWPVINRSIQKFQSIAIGPGLSLNSSTQKFVHKVIQHSGVPLVIDADALNALAGNTNMLITSDTPKILTPHPGEFARLISEERRAKSVKKNLDLEKNRKREAVTFATKYNCILVLKGARTIVADPSGKIYINVASGNVGLATAGSGDVLTGMITALLAQGLAPFDAAKYGVYLHGKAGDLAAKKFGKASMIATDIIDAIPKALKN